MPPGNEIVQREERREGEPARDAVIPGRVEEVRRRIEPTKHAGKDERFPADAASRSHRRPDRDSGRASFGYRTVGDSHERNVAGGELLQNLRDQETHSAAGFQRERAEIDRDTKGPAHGRSIP